MSQHFERPLKFQAFWFHRFYFFRDVKDTCCVKVYSSARETRHKNHRDVRRTIRTWCIADFPTASLASSYDTDHPEQGFRTRPEASHGAPTEILAAVPKSCWRTRNSATTASTSGERLGERFCQTMVLSVAVRSRCVSKAYLVLCSTLFLTLALLSAFAV